MNCDNLKIVNETNNFLFALCLFHTEQQGSLCINKVLHNDKPKGYWYCYGCTKSGQITSEEVDSLCQKPINYSKQQVKSKKDFNKLHHEYFSREFTEGKAQQLAGRWGVEESVMWELGCGYDGQAATFPMWELDNIIGIQRQFDNGFKCCVEGSALGLFVPMTKLTGDVLFIPEGVSDLACLLDMGYHGIARPNALVGKELVYNWLKRFNPSYKLIVIVGDNDEAGIRGAHELQDYIDSEHRRSEIYIPAQKDLRVDIQEYGKEYIKNCLKRIIDEIKI